MRVLLFILGIFAFLAGAVILVAAQSSNHEIEGFLLFLISAVFISGAAIVEAVLYLSKIMEEAALVHTRLLTALGTKSNVAQGDMKKCPFCAEMIQAEVRFCTHCGKELLQRQHGTDPDAIQKLPETEAEAQESLKEKRDILRKEADTLEQQYWQTNDPTLLLRITELRKQIESA